MERKEKKIRFYVKPSSQLTLFCLQDGIIVAFGEIFYCLFLGFLSVESFLSTSPCHLSFKRHLNMLNDKSKKQKRMKMYGKRKPINRISSIRRPPAFQLKSCYKNWLHKYPISMFINFSLQNCFHPVTFSLNVRGLVFFWGSTLGRNRMYRSAKGYH